jgi:hypothetical protein
MLRKKCQAPVLPYLPDEIVSPIRILAKLLEYLELHRIVLSLHAGDRPNFNIFTLGVVWPEGKLTRHKLVNFVFLAVSTKVVVDQHHQVYLPPDAGNAGIMLDMVRLILRPTIKKIEMQVDDVRIWAEMKEESLISLFRLTMADRPRMILGWFKRRRESTIELTPATIREMRGEFVCGSCG